MPDKGHHVPPAPPTGLQGPLRPRHSRTQLFQGVLALLPSSPESPPAEPSRQAQPSLHLGAGLTAEAPPQARLPREARPPPRAPPYSCCLPASLQTQGPLSSVGRGLPPPPAVSAGPTHVGPLAPLIGRGHPQCSGPRCPAAPGILSGPQVPSRSGSGRKYWA
ncbi:hypothetical protein NDU88_005803 [Pleurodeles waltl]|uniref:Uncharacterized protein n=1 Tax=Pleurodeles waltl TaxID=8319 RepID=A0AAV7QFR5_PLEWA|nr:hypothetical protein NDU88_005803 [Pleurodeles waltl]